MSVRHEWAYPQTLTRTANGDMQPPYENGMTYRQWLIGQALMGQCANPQPYACSNRAESADKLAKWSIDCADAIIARLDAEAKS